MVTTARIESMPSNGAHQQPGQVSILPLAAIWPCPQNDDLYKPVRLDDPEFLDLVASVREIGLQEPIVVTTDYMVLSGHRRREACKQAGIALVPCRIVPIRSSDPRCLRLLREFNRQRVKSFDEILREQLVTANPDEAHRVLLEHRRKAAKLSVDSMAIVGEKTRCTISAAKQPMLQAALAVIEQLKDYLPVTVRQIHYRLLNDPPLLNATAHNQRRGKRYENTPECYKNLCELLTRARLAGLVSWHVIHDPTRPMTVWQFHPNPGPFINKEIDGFLKGYYRDLMQSQPNHIEIVGEKTTIETIVRPLALEYCIPYTIGRGFCSLPPRYEMAKRFHASGREKLVVLILSDCDPDGLEIGQSFARSMRDDFGIEAVVPVKVGLSMDQVQSMELPPSPMKAKAKSANYAKYFQQFGTNDVYELEAVSPEHLQGLLRSAIDRVIDIEAFNNEVDKEKQDAAKLDALRGAVHTTIKSVKIGEGD